MTENYQEKYDRLYMETYKVRKALENANLTNEKLLSLAGDLTRQIAIQHERLRALSEQLLEAQMDEDDL